MKLTDQLDNHMIHEPQHLYGVIHDVVEGEVVTRRLPMLCDRLLAEHAQAMIQKREDNLQAIAPWLKELMQKHPEINLEDGEDEPL